MSDDSRPMSVPPFPPGYRASGVLLHVTSLPSPYGIGDVGPSALAWIDRLYEAGQTWWQALPLGPTGYGNSPYQSLSSFAGNWLLISPDGLIADGLLWMGGYPSKSRPFWPTTPPAPWRQPRSFMCARGDATSSSRSRAPRKAFQPSKRRSSPGCR